MNTTIHTATVLVAHRQAELRAQANRPSRRRPTGTASLADSFSPAALLRRLVPATRRPALV